MFNHLVKHIYGIAGIEIYYKCKIYAFIALKGIILAFMQTPYEIMGTT